MIITGSFGEDQKYTRTIGKTSLKIEICMIIEMIIIIVQARAELSNSQKQLKTNLMKSLDTFYFLVPLWNSSHGL